MFNWTVQCYHGSSVFFFCKNVPNTVLFSTIYFPFTQKSFIGGIVLIFELKNNTAIYSYPFIENAHVLVKLCSVWM